MYKWLLTTSEHPFKSVQFFKSFTFNVCKPPTHLAYLLDLKQLGGQSFLSCMKTKIKCIEYFLSSVRPKCCGVGPGVWKRRQEGLRWGGEKICATTILRGLPSLTLVFASVICLRASLKGTKNRISHCSKWLNSLRLGRSSEPKNFNEIKVSQGQYLFQLILTVTLFTRPDPRALTRTKKVAEKKDG